MNKDTKVKFKKEYTKAVRKLQTVERIDIIRELLNHGSFTAYHKDWLNRAITKTQKDNIIFIDIIDSTPFSESDCEFIIWTAFLDMYALVENPTERYTPTQKMTLEIFERPIYAMYLVNVLPLSMIGYIEDKRKELLASDRLDTIKEIINN